MNLKLGAIAAATGIATASVQLIGSLASGSYNAGSRMESMQTELKLLRSEIQNQSKLFGAQNQIVEFRLTQLEQAQDIRTSTINADLGGANSTQHLLENTLWVHSKEYVFPQNWNFLNDLQASPMLVP